MNAEVENFLEAHAEEDVTKLPFFMINALLRQAGIRLDASLIGELKSAHASLKKGTTVAQFIIDHHQLYDKLGAVLNNSNTDEDEREPGFECDCGFFTLNPDITACPCC